MNKADLADKAKTDEWIRWYKANGLSVIPISCTTGAGVNKIISSSRELIKDKLEREKERGRNRNLSIMMAGIPNVGKSSLINRLCGRASAKTGDKAGVTRGKQWIRLRDGTELFDTPGMLPPKFENQETAKRLAYTGAIKDEIINTELLAYSLCEYLRDEYPDLLCARYKLDSVDGLEGYEILEKIGKNRGFVISRGEIDTERAAAMLTDELRSAKIGNITLETPDRVSEENA